MYRAAVLTISDSSHRGERPDLSGPALADALRKAGIEVAAEEIVSDDQHAIVVILRKYCSLPDFHLVLTTGGTGFAPRDVTPEATREVVEKPAPGIMELLRQSGAKDTPLTWLSRGEAGISSGKLIINLPGSPKAMASSVETLKPILFHALDLLNGKKPH